MSQSKKINLCPVCGTPATKTVVSIHDVPVHCNLLWTDRRQALAAPKGDIHLVYCANCGHVFNQAFEPTLTEYTQAYENSLHFSPRFQEYATALASDLVERHDIRDRELVEIGAGQGDFLRMLCDLGDNRGVGFDAAYVAGAEDDADERLLFINEFAWQDHIQQVPDMIYARHVLEHIEQPADFVGVIRETIGEEEETLVYLEVPNMAYTLRELAIWDIIYEHCGYFTPHSLSCLMSRGRFGRIETKEVFGGQFLTVEAKPASLAAADGCATAQELREMAEQVDAFAAEFRQKVDQWQRQLAQWNEEGKRVVAWGAGSKGVTFLNILQAAQQVPYIVDINPRKLGMYVVGSGQEIVDPEFLRAYKPDIVILMNSIYRDEIAGMLAGIGVRAQLVAA